MDSPVRCAALPGPGYPYLTGRTRKALPMLPVYSVTHVPGCSAHHLISSLAPFGRLDGQATQEPSTTVIICSHICSTCHSTAQPTHRRRGGDTPCGRLERLVARRQCQHTGAGAATCVEVAEESERMRARGAAGRARGKGDGGIVAHKPRDTCWVARQIPTRCTERCSDRGLRLRPRRQVAAIETQLRCEILPRCCSCTSNDCGSGTVGKRHRFINNVPDAHRRLEARVSHRLPMKPVMPWQIREQISFEIGEAQTLPTMQ
jgi:hypothetical protein